MLIINGGMVMVGESECLVLVDCRYLESCFVWMWMGMWLFLFVVDNVLVIVCIGEFVLCVVVVIKRVCMLLLMLWNMILLFLSLYFGSVMDCSVFFVGWVFRIVKLLFVSVLDSNRSGWCDGILVSIC